MFNSKVDFNMFDTHHEKTKDLDPAKAKVLAKAGIKKLSGSPETPTSFHLALNYFKDDNDKSLGHFIGLLTASPQTISGLVIKIVQLGVTYKEQRGTLAMELDIEFRLGSEVQPNANRSLRMNNLTNKAQTKLRMALFASENIPSNFELRHNWTESALEDTPTPLLTRKFLLINENNSLTIKEMARENPNNIDTVLDPGMDGLFGGKADWEAVSNEREFCQKL